MKRIVLAFLVAPLAVPALFGAWILAQGAPGDSLLFAAVTGLYTYGAALIAGLPAVFLYRHMGWTRAWQFAAGGFVLGAAIFAAARWPSTREIVFYGALGALTAFAFWGVGVRGNAAFPLRREPGRAVEPVALRPPTLDEVKRRAESLPGRARDLATEVRANVERFPAPAAPAPERAPRFGLLAVAIPLLTTVGTLPWLWAALRRDVERLYTLGMLVAVAYAVAIVLLSATAVVLAIVAIVRRERYRYPLAAAAVLLAAAGLVLLRATFSR